MAPEGGHRAVRPTRLGLVALAALAVLAGCQGAPSPLDPASNSGSTVTPAAVPDDPEPARHRVGTESGRADGRRDGPLRLEAQDDVVLRNDRNVTFVVELYVDPGGTDAVDVTFVNGTTARLDESPDGVTGVNGSYRPFDPAALAGSATVVRPADADAVILPLTVPPGGSVRGELPPLEPIDTVLYIVRTYPTRPGRPGPIQWVDVLGCPTGYLGLTGSIEFDFSAGPDGGLTVERECTAPP